MNQLILKAEEIVEVGGIPRVSSLVLAKHCDIEHRAVLQLIDTHKDRLEKAFGKLAFEICDSAFEMRNSDNQRVTNAGRKTRIALLTEPQASTLITFFKNTDPVLDFKVALNKAFYELREMKTKPAYVGLFLQEIPREWQRAFPDSFFKSICDCYGLSYIKGRTPGFIGGFINTYIYEPLLSKLPSELKAKRKEYCQTEGCSESSHKLHQFLQDNCTESLSRHISTVETLLRISRTEQDFREHFGAAFEGKQQLMLEFNTKAERKKLIDSKKLKEVRCE